jgi:arsenite methyltransferase
MFCTINEVVAMPSLPVLKTVLREIFTFDRSPRVPEPDLVMDNKEKVAAYTRAGREDGVMAQTYLFNCAHICEIIKPGDTVIDLACGPATQLGMVARLNPDTHFVGIDLSEDMLSKATDHINKLGLKNVEFRLSNICALEEFNSSSIDAVFSTLSLHHLPDIDSLDKAFSEIDRILKKNGGLYLMDFSHLKSEKSIHYFAHQYHDKQPELFTQDYLNSLRAAFHRKDLEQLAKKYFSMRANFYAMYLMPFMITIKSPVCSNELKGIRKELLEIRQSLPVDIEEDLKDIIDLFRKGGMPTTLLK